MKDQDVTKSNLAQVLHEAASQCAKSTQEILKKCQKAALDGESSIRVRCSKADHEFLDQFSFGEQLPATPLVAELRNNGFHLKSDYEFPLFGGTRYYLNISW